jgi:hypothetical protein
MRMPLSVPEISVGVALAVMFPTITRLLVSSRRSTTENSSK